MRWPLVLALFALPGLSSEAETFWGTVQRGDTRRRDAFVEEGNLHLREARVRRSSVERGVGGRVAVFDPARAALASYERALTVGPEDADIHYRALMAAEYISEGDTELCHACRDGYEAVVHHIDALRRLDPKDTREVAYAWSAAVVLSKLGGLGGPDADQQFERAIEEYDHWRKLVDETDPARSRDLSTSYGNAAELMMAIGRLDDAIAAYQVAIELNPMESLGYFGLAVAYDRDGQWEKAVATMRDALAHPPGIQRLDNEGVFFVPEGDIYYYYALAHQIMRSDPGLVTAEYTRFLSRARGSKFQARAREHQAELSHDAGATAPR